MSTYISFFDEKLCMGQIKFHASQIRASILILLWAKDCFGNFLPSLHLIFCPAAENSVVPSKNWNSTSGVQRFSDSNFLIVLILKKNWIYFKGTCRKYATWGKVTVNKRYDSGSERESKFSTTTKIGISLLKKTFPNLRELAFKFRPRCR